MVFFSSNPVYDAILFYILFVTLIFFLKPNFVYCHNEKKFKQFGCDNNQTLACFPVVCVLSAIFIYFIFLMMQLLNNCLTV